MEKVLGKIDKCHIGLNGRNELRGFFSFKLQDGQYVDWSEIPSDVAVLMVDAKKLRFEDMKNVPIEATIDRNALTKWRVLTEVI